ncbi:MAG: hypothetical protein ACRET2_11755 [Steroidobacteraceae bacterium]
MNSRALLSLLLTASILAGGALATSAAQAETIVLQGQLTVAPSSVLRPSRGMRMARVEQQFGAPVRRHPTVGKPPITRWDYPQFAVFFEGDRVIDSVVTAQRKK